MLTFDLSSWRRNITRVSNGERFIPYTLIPVRMMSGYFRNTVFRYINIRVVSSILVRRALFVLPKFRVVFQYTGIPSYFPLYRYSGLFSSIPVFRFIFQYTGIPGSVKVPVLQDVFQYAGITGCFPVCRYSGLIFTVNRKIWHNV